MEKQCKKVSRSFGMVIFLWAINLSAQGPDVLWMRTYGRTENDAGRSVQETSDGGYIIVGYTESLGAGAYDLYLIKIDARGNTLWTKTYGGKGDDRGYSVQQTPDEGYIIAGYTHSFGASLYDVYFIKTDAKGDTIWTKTYGGEWHDVSYSVQQTSDEGYIIAGYTHSFGAGWDVYLIKTGVKGDILWAKTYGGGETDIGFSVQEVSDEGYIIAGHTWSFGVGEHDIYLIRTDARGNTLWTKTYGGKGDDRGYSVQQTPDEGYIIAGYTHSFGASLYDVYLIKTDAKGDTIWTKTYGGEGDDRGYSVQQTSDEGYIIAGHTDSFGAGRLDVYLIKTDARGNTLWTKTYGGSSWDGGYSVKQTSDGGYIIAGYTESFGAGSRDVYLIKTKPPLKLTSPNGGEVLVSNTIHHITWLPAGTGFDSYRLLYSLDGGESYPHIIASRVSPNSGLYSWRVPEIDCNTCRIKAQIQDMKGRIIVEDESDSNFTIQSTGIEERESLPKAFSVSFCEPNPSQADRILIKYGLPKSSNVHIVICNLLGQEIKTLLNKKENAGIRTIIWDGRDEAGERVSSGIYFLRFEAGGYNATRKLLIIK